MTNFPDPHGGSLIDPMLPGPEAREGQAESIDYLSIDLNGAQLCDLELLLNGGFSPLRGFMGQADCHSVVREMLLADGLVWPMPIMLAKDLWLYLEREGYLQ